jgi:S1-C subfamily serine protease
MRIAPTVTRRLVFSVACGIGLSCLLFVSGSAKAEDFGFKLVKVDQIEFFQPLRHNIANLRGARNSGEVFTARFLDHFNRTGGVERWGYPTSEILTERPGTLTQYYQRGVVDWQPVRPGGPYGIQRRLAWDYVGGGAGGSTDQGVEQHLTSPHAGSSVGPWGHKVSNVSVEGTWIGFQNFFDRLGGVEAFGYPKTDARSDTYPGAVIHDPTWPKEGRIRQYFQSTVVEYHPEDPNAPIKLRLLGDTLRNLKYPNNRWQPYAAFKATGAQSVGQSVNVNLLRRARPTERTVEAAVAFAKSSVVRVRVYSGQVYRGCGSGFFVDSTGYLATNWHVAKLGDRFHIRTDDGRMHWATLAAGDDPHDLALLRIDGLTTTPVDWNSSNRLGLGASLIALGYPSSVGSCSDLPTVTTGVFSTRLTLSGLEYLQTDTALNPGGSGGPVVAIDGGVIGITQGGMTNKQNTNFLIPEARARPIIEAWVAAHAAGRRDLIPAPAAPVPQPTPTPTPRAPTPTPTPRQPSSPGSLISSTGIAIGDDCVSGSSKSVNWAGSFPGNPLPSRFCYVIVMDWWPKGWSMHTVWHWSGGTTDKTTPTVGCTSTDCRGGYIKEGFTNSQGYGRNPGTVAIDLYVNASFVRRDVFSVT